MSSEATNAKVKEEYELLTIVDGKAQALLSFNAILLAAISIWLGYVPANYLHFCLDIAFLFLLSSCLLLLWVVWLYWSEPTAGLEVLKRLRDNRTWSYRAAWWISMSAVIVISLVSVVHTVGTGLTASKLCQSQRCQWFFSEKVFGNLDH